MKASLISIIVPVYNVEEYLDDCINSITNQTYKNIEIILIDDGSSDKSKDICDIWAQKDPRIKVIHKENGGLSDARNTGLEHATGEYIGFVDSDDYIDSQMFEKLINVFNTQENIGVASIQVQKDIDGNIKPFFDTNDLNEDRRIKGELFTKKIISLETCWTVWNKLYRHNLLRTLKFRIGRNNEDFLFLFYLGRILKDSKLDFYELSYPAYYYRVRENSICTDTQKPVALDIIMNLEEMMSRSKDVDISLFNHIKLLYLKINISFLDRMFNDTVLYNKHFQNHKNKISSISASWIYNNCPKKVIFQYLLYKYFPLGRKIMLSVIKRFPTLIKHFSS